MFEDLKGHIIDHDKLKPLTPDLLAQQRVNAPGVPEDYLTFLAEIGYGDINDNAFYSGLISGDEIYSRPELERYLLFVDDFSGYCSAFDPLSNWKVVVLTGRGEVIPKFDTFTQYIRNLLLE